MGYRVIRLHTSHDELAFKTFEAKQLFDSVHDEIEQRRHQTPVTAKAHQPEEDPLEQLRKLGDLRDAGILTEEEFVSKKASLLARL